MTAADRVPLPERVTVLETIVPRMEATLNHVVAVQEHQDGLLNTICVNVAALTSRLETVVGEYAQGRATAAEERSRWKDPMLYVTAISVLVALAAVYTK